MLRWKRLVLLPTPLLLLFSVAEPAVGAPRAVESASTAGSRFKTVLHRTRLMLADSPEAALQLASQVERTAGADPSAPEEVSLIARWLRAEALLRLGREEEARRLTEAIQERLEVAHAGPRLRGDVLLTRGSIRSADGEVAGALADYQGAHGWFVQARHGRGRALALASMASLYREGGDFAGALRYYRQAEEASAGDPILLRSIYNGRGNVLNEMEQYGQAGVAFGRALSLSEGASPTTRALILANIARTQLSAGNADGAARTVARGLQLTASGDARIFRPHMEGVAARVAAARGRVDEARALIERVFAGVDLAKTTLAMRDNHLTAAQVYEASGEPEKAVEHLTALRRLDDQALEIATSARTALMSARFDFQNQELRIARLKAEELRRNVAFERSRTRFERILFGGITFSIAVLAALLSFGLVTLRRSRNETRAANVELGSTNVSLEKALAAKTEFLATTSHEIRTPLNGILGMTQVMLADKELDPATRDRIDVVHGAGVTMRALVDDILDVAKMETGNLTVEVLPTNLHATLTEVSRLWQEQARARGLSFALDLEEAPRWIESDPGRLRQIVFNLLSNALKFTQRGEVGLRVFVEGPPEARRLRIAVRDTGIGIPPAKHAQIFESFRQVDAGTTRRFGGTGLGLTICRNLAEALGGGVEVESAEGAGSTFTVDLPLVEVAVPEDRACSDANPCALIVLERNPIARGMLKSLLADRVPDLRFAQSVEEAIEALGQGGVASVVADGGSLAVGGASEPGQAVASLRRLSAAARAADAEVIVLWARPEEEQRTDLLAAGADRILAKPISATALMDGIFASASGIGGKLPLVSRAA